MRMFVVHGRQDCPFCESALNMLSCFKSQIAYAVRFYEKDQRETLILEQNKWNWSTVPVVVEVVESDSGDTVERLVGGYTDLCLELGVNPDDY